MARRRVLHGGGGVDGAVAAGAAALDGAGVAADGAAGFGVFGVVALSGLVAMGVAGGDGSRGGASLCQGRRRQRTRDQQHGGKGRG